MAGRNHSEKTTKELILDAAFSFCKEPRFSVFSMSELAAKVGISKPAIYRHFKDKDAVLAAMRERFIEALANCLRDVQDVCNMKRIPVDAVANVVQFFTENSYYVNYMMGCLASVKNFEFLLTEELEKRGIQVLAGFQFQQDASKELVIKDFNRYVQTIYCGVTIFTFIKGREKHIAEGCQPQPVEEFAHKLVTFLAHGFAGTTEKNDLIYPLPITDARIAELDALCTIDDDLLPDENRFFTAFASVIKKYKMTGVTVERIADELGMAKSSLYEYFDNKSEMIRSLIAKELALLDTIIKENTVEAQNLTEYLYILMRTEFSFFSLRASIIPICGWLLMNSADDHLFCDMEGADMWINRLPNPLPRPDFGMTLTPMELLGWISCLPISLVMQCAERNLQPEALLEALKHMFDFVQNGIEPKE